jgi:DNA repair protein SbcD/Mre11
MFSFLHVADIHLDSPLRGLARYEGAPMDEIRGASRQALANLVDYALENAIGLMVLAGDVYDGDCPDFQTLLHFSSQMSRLREHGTQVVMIRGNHDADNPMTSSLQLPDNVTTLSSARPETWHSPTLPVAVHGQSYASRDITDNLAASYPAPTPGLFNIGLLHTAMSGQTADAVYAPCSLADLGAKAYQYWALGHVHEFELVSRDPYVVYSGCIQGRHVREPGAKGCVRVDVADDGSLTVHRVMLDVLRWTQVDIDVSGARTENDLHLAVSAAIQNAVQDQDGRLSAMRLRLHGQCPLHERILHDPDRFTSQIRLMVTDIARHRAWVEKILLETLPELDLDELGHGNTPQAALLHALRAMAAHPEELGRLGVNLRDLRSKLAGSGVLVPDLGDPASSKALVQDVQNLLLPLLAASTTTTDHAH